MIAEPSGGIIMGILRILCSYDGCSGNWRPRGARATRPSVKGSRSKGEPIVSDDPAGQYNPLARQVPLDRLVRGA